jgi:UDP-N-acetylglucosamine 3-dehydrogenase
MVKIGVLGSGLMGSRHARAYSSLLGVQVIGVSSRHYEKAAALANELGAEPFTDAIALATDPRIDAVSVTLPTPLHKDYVVESLNAGKHVFVEKPMGLTVEECDVMIQAARENDRLLLVAHVLRFWPEYVALADVVNSGQLGSPLAAKASRLSTYPAWGDWFANPAWTGGAVLDMLVHDVDAFNWLFGTPRSVYARGHRGAAGGWDHVLALVDYGEVKAFAEDSFLMPKGYPSYMTLWVLCEKGSVEFTFRAAGLGGKTGADPTTGLMVYESGKAPRRLSSAGGSGYENEVAYFVACIHKDCTPDRGTAAQGRLAVRTALAARRSLETDQVVVL